MHVLANAQNVIVNGGQFTDINTNNFNDGLSGIDTLLDASVPDAAVDAEARRYAPSCFPGTREQYIEDIVHWASASTDDQLPPIYWMRGPAGVGKSAIAQTCAERLLRQGQLGGAFFFSINGRDDHTRLFTTIAYQLSTSLPGYRKVLNDAVLNDKTIVRKNISSQFDWLIVAPLRQLSTNHTNSQLPRRTIFIDGLDECKSKDAQCEIVNIIAASARIGTTPFRWALFSRPEPHIEATFTSLDIASYCRRVLLPISRQQDGEIELYLKGGFRNILRRRNLSSSSPWPSEKDLKKLIDASAGLFAYPAAVLRFIDHYPSFRLEEPLQVVLAATSQQRPQPRDAPSPFAALDAFYMLIMQRIPDHILPSIKLLFADMLMDNFTRDAWPVAFLCNILGLTESEFRGIYGQLHAVLHFQDCSEPVRLNDDIDVARPYYAQLASFYPNPIFFSWLARSLGGVAFYHKSFYDFLADSERSGPFCVTTQSIRQELFAKYMHRHLDYARSYVMSGTPQFLSIPVNQNMPDLAPDLRRAAGPSQLSWPLANEFVNSYLEDSTFLNTTGRLLHYPRPADLEAMPTDILRELFKLEYQKYLKISFRSYIRPQWKDVVVGCPGDVETDLHNVIFRRIKSENYHEFDSKGFLRMVEKLEKLGIIKAYHLTFAARCKSFLQNKRKGSRRSGLFTRGYGDQTIFWYWELDTKLKYYHEFHALNLASTMWLYKTRLPMWKQEDCAQQSSNVDGGSEEALGWDQAWRKLQEPDAHFCQVSYCGEGIF